jgi:hypothetical protein
VPVWWLEASYGAAGPSPLGHGLQQCSAPPCTHLCAVPVWVHSWPCLPAPETPERAGLDDPFLAESLAHRIASPSLPAIRYGQLALLNALWTAQPQLPALGLCIPASRRCQTSQHVCSWTAFDTMKLLGLQGAEIIGVFLRTQRAPPLQLMLQPPLGLHTRSSRLCITLPHQRHGLGESAGNNTCVRTSRPKRQAKRFANSS